MSPRATHRPAPARRAPAARPRRRLGLLVLAASLALPACADEQSAAREQALATAREALAEDASGALHLAKAALNEHGDDPALHELAAAACVALERYADAMTHARAGLDAEPEDADLVADLEFQYGKAALGRYRGVHASQDWSVANLSLQRATGAGSHRVEAATLLVIMQFMDGRNDLARARQFAELVETLEPGGDAARQVQALLAKEAGE